MTISEPSDRISPAVHRPVPGDLGWMWWTALGVGGIWVAVLLISLLAPDLVSGSEQEHLPVAAFTSWVWGGVGTVAFLWAMVRLRDNVRWQPAWIGVSVVTLAVWAIATVLGITLPVFETGSDPTRIPVAAILAPAAAAMITALAAGVITVFHRVPGGG
jgi:hypothetical protein